MSCLAIPIEAKNTGNGLTYRASSTGTGNYTLAQLPVSTYEISVTATGFKAVQRRGGFRQHHARGLHAASGRPRSVTITEADPLPEDGGGG